ncbi:outer membrane transport energization protein TonB [Luteibacter rhizovicinus]|uniref:Protein TonB n=1 Tax=Luteibacter rhizovicinus TaxID=242606 RepID=A0A4R3YV93_9GAMM|nr:energy transducer TonB [Luteibacter rhizovicinus]TCV95728.1 outer membrane transport energization protein TonB [Luteibacter rhizovicinus]
MQTRNRIPARMRVRGAVSPVVLAVMVIVLALAIAAWFLIVKPYRDANQGIAPVGAVAPTAAAAKAAPPVANVESLSVDQLLAEARKAMNEQRLVAPAGNNAFEFYMKVLEKQPGHPVAADALRETFPFGATATEQTINQRDFGEAQREIDLLAKADPENYTLTILRSKLDAQRKTLDREQQAALDQQKQQQLAAQTAAAAAKQQAADQVAEAQRQQVAREQAARLAQQQQASAAVVGAAKPAAAKPAAAAGGDGDAISDAVLTKQVRPRYPTAAMRANQEGWVDVELSVDGQGVVTNVSVVDSQPKHVFDRAALDAVGRWEFKPAMRNGEPMPVTLRRRILFNLGR